MTFTSMELRFRCIRPYINRVTMFGIVLFASSTLLTAQASESGSNEDIGACAARAIRCKSKSPQKPLKLCFISDHRFTTSGPLQNLFCDSSFEKYQIDSVQEIAGILDGLLEKECATIESIAFRDHGLPGVQKIGETEISFGGKDLNSNLFHDGKYECMIAKKSRLIFQGCYLADGCKGQLFMSRIARSFSPNQEVTVLASPTQANAFFTGVTSRVGAVGGREVRLRRHPNSEKWWYSGIFSGKKTPPSVAEACTPEFEKSVIRAKRILSVSQSDLCKDSEFGKIASKKLQTYKTQAETCLQDTRNIKSYEAFTESLDHGKESAKKCGWEDVGVSPPVTLLGALVGCGFR